MKDTMIVESLNGNKTVEIETTEKSYFLASMKTSRGDYYEMSIAAEDYATAYNYATSRTDECVAFRVMSITVVKEV